MARKQGKPDLSVQRGDGCMYVVLFIVMGLLASLGWVIVLVSYPSK